MSKRFTDTEKYKNPFIRGLKGPYKLLWDYLYHNCNHAGIWVVDFEIAQIYLGGDMPVERDIALSLFNNGQQRIFEFCDSEKWFIKSFVEFQYGHLKDENRVHNSVIKEISKYDELSPLLSPLQGVKDKEKEKDKDKSKVKVKNKYTEEFETWWKECGRGSKANAFKRWGEQSEKPVVDELIAIHKKYANHCISTNRTLKDSEGWINGRFWESDWSIENNNNGNQFEPPTIKEAMAYIEKYAVAHKLIVDNKYCGMTAERFINHYSATNWKRKGEQIEDWEGLLANFVMSDYNRGDIARAN